MADGQIRTLNLRFVIPGVSEKDLEITVQGNQLFLERILPMNESIWAVGPFGILKRDRTEAAWRNPSITRSGPTRSGS